MEQELNYIPSFNFSKQMLENSVRTPEEDKITKLDAPPVNNKKH